MLQLIQYVLACAADGVLWDLQTEHGVLSVSDSTAAAAVTSPSDTLVTPAGDTVAATTLGLDATAGSDTHAAPSHNPAVLQRPRAQQEPGPSPQGSYISEDTVMSCLNLLALGLHHIRQGLKAGTLSQGTLLAAVAALQGSSQASTQTQPSSSSSSNMEGSTVTAGSRLPGIVASLSKAARMSRSSAAAAGHAASNQAPSADHVNVGGSERHLQNVIADHDSSGCDEVVDCSRHLLTVATAVLSAAQSSMQQRAEQQQQQPTPPSGDDAAPSATAVNDGNDRKSSIKAKQVMK